LQDRVRNEFSNPMHIAVRVDNQHHWNGGKQRVGKIFGQIERLI
jgi:hypothetical protein